MILAAVDDLLFSSKIRTTAKGLGTDIVFARTAVDVLARAEELKPSLILMDLSSEKTDPIATIAALRAAAPVGTTRILAFASHVRTDLIAAALAAGADQVLARSAFASNLPDILSGSR